MEGVCSFFGREDVFVAVVEPEAVEQYVPSLFFIYVDDVERHLPLLELTAQAHVGQQPVESSDGGLVGAGVFVLYEEVSSGAASDLTGVKVVSHGHIVVAVTAARFVEGEASVEFGASDVDSVYVPSKGFDEGFLSCHDVEGWGVVTVFSAVVVDISDVKQHAVSVMVGIKDVEGLFQSVGRHVVVAVEIRCERRLDEGYALIACISLAVVCVERHHLNAGVCGCILPQDGQRAVR